MKGRQAVEKFAGVVAGIGYDSGNGLTVPGER